MKRKQGTVKVWRVYNSGTIANETRVLWPHDGGTGYQGDVEAWSAHNKVVRFGCAQIKQEEGAYPVVLFSGYLSKERLAAIIKSGALQ